MKRFLISLVLGCALAVNTFAQNVQFHYDFGHQIYDSEKTRPKLTTTVEMFKPDKWGSTFFFVDMDYTKDGVSAAYWEIARELKFWEGPISAHVEYNGGVNGINHAFLFGPTYSWNSKDFSKGISFTPMYKYIKGNTSPHNFQLTAVWYANFDGGKFSFNGFADFWREKFNYMAEHEYTFLTEPQFWVNLNKFKGVDPEFNLSIGTEWELSNNFAVYDGFRFNPTLALKWTFK